MSQLSLLKLTFSFCFTILLTPSLTQAKTVEFNNRSWEVAMKTTSSIQEPAIRNSFTSLQAAKNILSGNSLLNTTTLLSADDAGLIMKISEEVSQPVKEALLEIKNNRAVKFEPGQDGLSIDMWKLRESLLSSASIVTLTPITVKPNTTLADTNSLGINELVAIGESDFTGSPKNRTHNVTVGASKFNGIIVAPGEEFSFNKYLGNVDAENGFLPELVIKPGALIAEFGGGLCQVSSTTFRAAMNAGLPITARRNHSFAVQYYAPQGTDATIYPGVVDFKFVNNLQSHLLMKTKIVGTKLYFEFYGTKDTREVAFEGPTQYDKKANGSMKATWTRHVTQNGSTTTQTFNSTYQPPALFPKVTSEESSIPNPQAEPSVNENNEPIPQPTT